MNRPTPAEVRELAGAHLARLLLGALRQVEAASLAALHERGHAGVRTGHIPVFAAGDGTRITDLAAGAGMTRQMMGRLVRELAEAGYVTARTDPADQRAVVVALTDRGWAFCDDAREVMAALEARYADLLGPDAFTALRTALTDIAHEP